MARLDIFIKVQIDSNGEEKAEKLGSEICRQVEKVYGVRTAEMINYVEHE